jgi:hypothetical protein
MSTRRRRRLKTNFSAYLDASFPGLIRWPLQEVSGTTALAKQSGIFNPALDGTNNGATVGQTFGGNIQYSYSFDGSNDNVVVSGAALAAEYSITTGEIVVFGTIDSSVAGDGSSRLMFQITAGTDNVDIRKSGSNIVYHYKAGAVTKDLVLAGQNPTTPFMASIAFGDANNGDFVTGYFNASQVDTSASSGFSAVGAIDGFTIGSTVVVGFYWCGLETQVLLFPSPLTNSERNEIYARSGI